MPTYQYQCRDCGHGFDQYQKFSDDPLTVCPSCGGEVRRVIQNVGVVFKGSGWYITDSRKANTSESSNGSSHSTTSRHSHESTKSDGDSAAPKDSATATETKSTSTKTSSPAAS